ncbi:MULTISPECIES: hypothetical protein [Nocardiaceae]|uniref:hypothetical protein n=1 Tax=Nocardiaceae TaxID=85025 RepID=UPI001179E3B0|nr:MULTISPECIES: hypothetical protein [Rhodococcus]
MAALPSCSRFNSPEYRLVLRAPIVVHDDSVAGASSQQRVLDFAAQRCSLVDGSESDFGSDPPKQVLPKTVGHRLLGGFLSRDCG